ncbi:MAG: hypothetical protein HY870_14435 [Chloroflexi bacterium]|nr:hypothetical protein [Chloroflexota bacterium]
MAWQIKQSALWGLPAVGRSPGPAWRVAQPSSTCVPWTVVSLPDPTILIRKMPPVMRR